jgi:methylisocitrate lyase
MKKTTILRKAIEERRAVTVPGCHDALSAKVIEINDFEAIQVSGYGLAGSFLGKPDVGLMTMKEVLDLTWNIIRAVDIPVMADADTGGGNAVNAADITEKLITIGAAGMNIEDQFFPKRCGHMKGKEVISADEMVGKIRACVEVRDKLDKDFIINARTDADASHGLDEAIRRCNLYAEAGADLLFVDAIRTRDDIKNVIANTNKPVSVNLMDAVTGVKTELIPVPELAEMGVGRVSIPVASVMVAHRALSRFFQDLSRNPKKILPGHSYCISSFPEYTGFVGLNDYKEQEKKYLPKELFEKKYECS